ADPTAGEMSIGCTEPLASGFVSAIIDRLSPQHPKAIFHVVTDDLVLLRDRHLRDRDIELALMPIVDPTTLPQDMNAEVLFDDRHIVLAAAKSKWLRRRNLLLVD